MRGCSESRNFAQENLQTDRFEHDIAIFPRQIRESLQHTPDFHTSVCTRRPYCRDTTFPVSLDTPLLMSNSALDCLTLPHAIAEGSVCCRK